MASKPFGGHPTLGQYMLWASQIGCTVQSGVRQDDDDKPVSIVRIQSDTGWVIIADTAQSEHLVPTFISYLDRRLGLKSPFFSIDPDSPSYV